MLEKVLADTYALSLKTQNYHWNVKGEHFKSIHELLDTHYQDFIKAIDLIAEHMVARGQIVEATFKRFDADTSIQDGKGHLKAHDMIKDLRDDHKKIQTTMKEAVKKARETDDIATEDILIDRLHFHEKAHWMLDAMLR